MKRSICLLFIAAWLALFAVGSVQAQPVANVTGLTVDKPALAGDGTLGGVRVTRDAMALWGGTPGVVNTGLTGRCLIGPYATGYEWCALVWMDNYAASGENVALYAQAQKRGVGPTWAQVVELNDTTGNWAAAVAQEIDLMVNGPDSGNRVGIDMVLGDARQARGLAPTAEVGGSVALRIQARGEIPKWTRGIWLRSKYVIGIDTSDATFDGAVIRIGAGQRIALEGTGQVTFRFENNDIVWANGATTLMRLDIATGALRVRGAVLPNTP